MGIEVDYTFHSMGSDIRLQIGRALAPGAPPPQQAAQREHAWVLDFAHRLSRFVDDSELAMLNTDPRVEVPASELLRAAVGAGLWAAERSGGLVDPTLVRELERGGYVRSMDGVQPASLSEALAWAPARRPAAPDPRERWRQVSIDPQAGTITRPPGVLIDTGGTGKGLCADAVAHRLSGYTQFLVDCGGDIAVGGVGTQFEPFEVAVEHPITGALLGIVTLTRGGIATSGLNVRIWRNPGGTYSHHLLDPSTGAPAWTGLIGVTALGSCALEAETLTKLGLLLGPDGAREVISEHGGVIVFDDGSYEAVALELREVVSS
jgi:thiamine biosynthesis lipoprotein